MDRKRGHTDIRNETCGSDTLVIVDDVEIDKNSKIKEKWKIISYTE